MTWKNFFYFSKQEQQGIIILIALIAGIFIGKLLFESKSSSVTYAETEAPSVALQTVYKEQPVTGGSKDKQTVQPTYYKNSSPKNNRRDETRTYYVQSEKPAVQPAQNIFPYQKKLKEGEVIELNSADTTQLKMIPGIGTSYARRIAGYRRLLGGFYRKEQLLEVYGLETELYEKISPYLIIDTALITAIPVNTASLDKLKAHPYLRFFKAKAIVELRRKKGKISSISELESLEEFAAGDLEKVKVYLEF
jgi:DNA uptake protein ComE-like DNA-binding protein